MHQLKEEFLRALSQCTRFDLLPTDQPRNATPVRRIWLVGLRSAMGLTYGLIAWLVMTLVVNHLGGAILATAAILALHSYLTAGKDNRLILRFLSPAPASDAAAVAQQVLALAVPPVMIFLLIFWNSAEWLLPAFALGTAAGGEICLNRSASPGHLPAELNAWALAAILTIVSLVLPNLAAATRHLAFTQALLVVLFMILVVPWLKRLPGRPAGFTAGCFLGELTVILFALLCAII